MSHFKFELGSKVKIVASGAIGDVLGRSEYVDSGNYYWLRYTVRDGQVVEAYWSEESLELVQANLAAA